MSQQVTACEIQIECCRCHHVDTRRFPQYPNRHIHECTNCRHRGMICRTGDGKWWLLVYMPNGIALCPQCGRMMQNKGTYYRCWHKTDDQDNHHGGYEFFGVDKGYSVDYKAVKCLKHVWGSHGHCENCGEPEPGASG